MQAELPALHQRLAVSKAAFAQLRISDKDYERLRAAPDEAVGVVGHVQLKVYELLRASALDDTATATLRAQATSAGNAAAQLQAEVAAKDALQARLTEAHA
eukprot:3689574-Prymnesium_polylepis.1